MDLTQQKIINLLKTKSSTKQQIYRTTLEVFKEFKNQLMQLSNTLTTEMLAFDSNVEIKYSDNGQFESHFKFSGDTLVIMMHTNVFSFPENHILKNSKYIKEDPMREFCGLIQVYNFLSDSIKYNREMDMGELLARVYINKDNHFFIEGRRPLSIMHNNLATDAITPEVTKKIIEEAVMYCINYDLVTPPFEMVKNITVEQKNYMSYSSGFATAKSVGFELKNQFNSESK